MTWVEDVLAGLGAAGGLQGAVLLDPAGELL